MATPLEQELRQLARDLLSAGEVEMVLGYRPGPLPRHARPAFVSAAEAVDELVLNGGCGNNLSVYLRDGAAGARVAIVAKPCDQRTLIALMQEYRLRREDVVIIGVNCGGVINPYQYAEDEPAPPWGEVPPERQDGCCRVCDARTVTDADHVLSAASRPRGAAPDPLAELSRPAAALKAFWERHMTACTRCYACRDVCPFCYCNEPCMAEKPGNPAYIATAVTPESNLLYHLMRAYHLAGRCTACGACDRACAEGVPLHLLNLPLYREAAAQFGRCPGEHPELKPVLFCLDTKQ